MTKHLSLTIILFFLILQNNNAQQELSLHFMNNAWQSNLTNPALKSSEKIQLILPSIYYSIYSPDFTIKKLLQPDADGHLNVSEVAKNRLQLRNRLAVNAQILSLGISIPISNKLTLSLYHATKSHSSIDLDGNLLKMVLVDNIEYVGKTHKFSSKMNGSVYSEIGFGGIYSVTKNVQIGIRLKMLSGIAGVFTEGGESIVTLESSNYAMSLNNNINVNTYSLTQFKKINTPKEAFDASFSRKNSGYSLDLGTQMQFGKLNFAVSLIDVGGYIRWKQEGKKYTSLGELHYDGIKTATISLENSLNKSSITSNLKESVKFNETINPRFIEKIPTKFYLSSTYNWTEKWMIGALICQENDQFTGKKTGFAFNTTYKFLKSLQLGSTWALRNGYFNNWGLHLIVQLGSIQLYGVTDNIISAVQPYNSKNSNSRIGLNIIL